MHICVRVCAYAKNQNPKLNKALIHMHAYACVCDFFQTHGVAILQSDTVRASHVWHAISDIYGGYLLD